MCKDITRVYLYVLEIAGKTKQNKLTLGGHEKGAMESSPGALGRNHLCLLALDIGPTACLAAPTGANGE